MIGSPLIARHFDTGKPAGMDILTGRALLLLATLLSLNPPMVGFVLVACVRVPPSLLSSGLVILRTGSCGRHSAHLECSEGGKVSCNLHVTCCVCVWGGVRSVECALCGVGRSVAFGVVSYVEVGLYRMPIACNHCPAMPLARRRPHMLQVHQAPAVTPRCLGAMGRQSLPMIVVPGLPPASRSTSRHHACRLTCQPLVHARRALRM